MSTTDTAAEKDFSIDYAGGSLSIRASANASAESLLILNRLTQQVMLQICGRATRTPIDQATSPNGSLALPASQPGLLIMQTHSVSADRTAGAASGPPQAAQPHPADASADRSMWLSDAIEQWRLESGVRFSAETWQYSYRPTFRAFCELVGNTRRDRRNDDGTLSLSQLDIRLCQLAREDIDRFHQQLKLLPPRQGERDDGIEAPERIRRARAQGLPAPSPDSVEKKLGHVKPFLRYARQKGWISADIVDELALALKSASTRAAKSKPSKPGAVALTDDELRRTFENETFRSDAIKHDWAYWTPLLRLFAGGRLAEVSQLFTDDIVHVEGVPCLSFIDDPTGDYDAIENPGDGKAAGRRSAQMVAQSRRLKNSASRRIVPIHPQLIELGFLDFVAQRLREESTPSLLFKGLRWESKSGYGRKPGQHLRTLLQNAGVWVRRKKVGHSLRSNFKIALDRADVPTELQQRLLGHSTGTMKEQAYNETDVGPYTPAKLVIELLARARINVSPIAWHEVLAMRAGRSQPKVTAESPK